MAISVYILSVSVCAFFLSEDTFHIQGSGAELQAGFACLTQGSKTYGSKYKTTFKTYLFLFIRLGRVGSNSLTRDRTQVLWTTRKFTWTIF